MHVGRLGNAAALNYRIKCKYCLQIVSYPLPGYRRSKMCVKQCCLAYPHCTHTTGDIRRVERD